jgi:hypothetical protein
MELANASAAPSQKFRCSPAERLGEHQREPGVGERERGDFAAGDALAQEQRRQDHHDGRVGEEQQPSEPGRYVLERQEVEKARAVIAQDAERDDGGELASGERPVLGAASHPHRRRDEERHGEHHAQREQGDRIRDPRVSELDEDRPQREEDDAADRQQQPGDEPAALCFALAQRAHRAVMRTGYTVLLPGNDVIVPERRCVCRRPPCGKLGTHPWIKRLR